MALITVKNVTLGFENHAIVRNLDFFVNEGDYLCIVGENGSGKTTLMKALLGLNPPIGGVIAFGEGLKENEIGYLPQQTVIQKDFPASVYEVVLSGLQGRLGFRPFYSKAEKARAKEMMERLGIADLSKRSLNELSGGQKQRVLLARALLATGKVLLLDEPTAGLDPKATEDMYRLIDELNRDGITILMISHDVRESIRHANRVLHIGNTLFFGTVEEYLKNQNADAEKRKEAEHV